MKHIVEFPLQEGGFIFVEVESATGSSLVPAATPGEVAGRVSQTFEAALAKAKPAAAAMIAELRDLVDPPDEVEMEFGIKLSADAGAFLASAGAEANYKITLTWKRSRTQ